MKAKSTVVFAVTAGCVSTSDSVREEGHKTEYTLEQSHLYAATCIARNLEKRELIVASVRPINQHSTEVLATHAGHTWAYALVTEQPKGSKVVVYTHRMINEDYGKSRGKGC